MTEDHGPSPEEMYRGLFDHDFGTAGMEDDSDDAWCIYCGKVLTMPEIRFNSDGTKDHACYGCAYENGWIDDDESEADDE